MINLEGILQETNPLGNSISLGALGLEKYSERWAHEIWMPYQKEKGVVRSLYFSVEVPTFDVATPFATIKIDLQTGEEFFKDFLEAYLKLGSACIQAMLHSAAWKSITLHTRKFVLSTVAFVETLFFHHFIEIESDATAAALKENEEMQKRLVNSEKGFVTHKYPQGSELVSIERVDEEGVVWHFSKNDLYKLLILCWKINSKMSALKTNIDERNKKDGSTAEKRRANRAKFPYKQKWLDIWQGPYNALMLELQDAAEKIYKIFSPALLILDELGEDINNYWPDERGSASDRQYRASRDVQIKYDSMMRQFLKDSLLELEQIKLGLLNPGISSTILTYLQQDVEGRLIKFNGIFSVVINFCLEEKPGMATMAAEPLNTGATILGLFESDTWKKRQNFAQTNRIMGHIRPLTNLTGNPETETQTFRDILLRSYIYDLQRKQIALAMEEKSSRSMWHIVQIAFGVLAIVAGVVTLIFGYGTIPIAAGLTLLATAAKSILFFLGVALLIRATVEQIKAIDQDAISVRNSLIDMAMNNSETFLALGENMKRNRNALATAGIEVLKQLALIPLSRFRIIEIAMEIEMHVSTVDMVMGTLSSSESEAAQ